jgi:4-carboxymuconolactone decarboxylase
MRLFYRGGAPRATIAAMTERWQRGLAAYASQFGIAENEVWERLAGLVGEPMAREAIESAGGGAWEDGVLSLRDRSLIVLAALVAQGGVEVRMRPHVRWAIEHGATREELEAMAALLAIYVGYPRASVGAQVIREELDTLERGELN